MWKLHIILKVSFCFEIFVIFINVPCGLNPCMCLMPTILLLSLLRCWCCALLYFWEEDGVHLHSILATPQVLIYKVLHSLAILVWYNLHLVWVPPCRVPRWMHTPPPTVSRCQFDLILIGGQICWWAIDRCQHVGNLMKLTFSMSSLVNGGGI